MRQWFNQLVVEYPHQLPAHTGRVGQRPQNIEYSAYRHFLARTDCMFHRTMVFGCEHKPDPDLIDTGCNLFRIQIQIDTCCLEQIGTTGFARNRAITVLGNLATSGSHNKCTGRGNIEAA